MIKAEFQKNVNTIKHSSENLANLIHESAMYALEQINLHGNTNPVNVLIPALHHSQRKQALVTWFEDHCLAVRQEDKTFKASKQKKIIILDKDGNKVEYTADEAIVHADENPYYDYTKETKPASSFDILKAVQSLLHKIETKTASGIQVDHYELKAKLAELVPQD